MRFQFILILLFASLFTFGQPEFIHPRGIITPNEVLEIKEKILAEPYKSWFEKIAAITQNAEKEVDDSDPYSTSFLALKQAQMHILTGDNKWAEKSYSTLQKVISHSIYNDPVSRGLTRATMLFSTAMC